MDRLADDPVFTSLMLYEASTSTSVVTGARLRGHDSGVMSRAVLTSWARHAAWQWVQIPASSITGDFGVKPAERAPRSYRGDVDRGGDGAAALADQNTTSSPAA